MSDQSDSWFVRMSEVRQEINQNLFPSIAKFIKEALEDLKGDVLSIDKLAMVLTKLDERIKKLELKVNEKDLENKNDR